MPVDLWEDVAGLTCDICKINPATHFYPHPRAICCQCHDVDGGGLITPAEAAQAHRNVLENRK